MTLETPKKKPPTTYTGDKMREFTIVEYMLIARGLRILQSILTGSQSAKCHELAEYFESMARVTGFLEDEESK